MFRDDLTTSAIEYGLTALLVSAAGLVAFASTLIG